MEIKRILYPTDLSDNSLKALPYARHMSEKFGAGITLLYVGFDLKNYFPAFGGPTDEHERHYLEWECAEAEKRLKKLCSDDLDGCPALDVKIKLGEPAREILDYIRNNAIDTVVMATHGHGSSKDDAYPFGSVSEKVVKNASVPVYVINSFPG